MDHPSTVDASTAATLAIVRHAIWNIRRLMEQAIDAGDAEWLRVLDDRWSGVMPPFASPGDAARASTRRRLDEEARAIRFELLVDAHREARSAADSRAWAPLLSVLGRHFPTFEDVQTAASRRLAQLAAAPDGDSAAARRATNATLDVTAVALLAAVAAGEQLPALQPQLADRRESLAVTLRDLSPEALSWRLVARAPGLQHEKAQAVAFLGLETAMSAVDAAASELTGERLAALREFVRDAWERERSVAQLGLNMPYDEDATSAPRLLFAQTTVATADAAGDHAAAARLAAELAASEETMLVSELRDLAGAAPTLAAALRELRDLGAGVPVALVSDGEGELAHAARAEHIPAHVLAALGGDEALVFDLEDCVRWRADPPKLDVLGASDVEVAVLATVELGSAVARPELVRRVLLDDASPA